MDTAFRTEGDPAGVRRLIGLTGQYASVDEDLTGLENLVMIGSGDHCGRPASSSCWFRRPWSRTGGGCDPADVRNV